jgi:heme exporter protein A
MDHSGPGGCYLEVQNLSCVRDDRILFAQLSFKLDPKQVLLLEGKNGSGKTSLLRILCGFREADEGEIRWCGELVSKSEFYAQMAYIGHLDGVKKELTVLENLAMALALGEQGEYTFADALRKVHLAGYDDVLVQSLSAGQRRRLSLARLLVTHNHLWILDEPFTSLDKDGIAIIEKMMVDHIARGGMIIMTSHHDISLHDHDVHVQRILLSRCL